MYFVCKGQILYNLLFMNQQLYLEERRENLRLFVRNVNIVGISGGGSHACKYVSCVRAHTFLWSFALAQKFNFEYCIMNWTGCGWNPHGRNLQYCLGGLRNTTNI